MIIQDANLKDFLVRKDNARMGARESLVYIRAQRMTDELNPARVRPSHRAPPWTTTRPTHSTSARSPLDRATPGHDPRGGDAQWPAARPPRAGCGELARRAHGERLTIFMLERAGGAGHRRRPADE